MGSEGSVVTDPRNLNGKSTERIGNGNINRTEW